MSFIGIGPVFMGMRNGALRQSHFIPNLVMSAGKSVTSHYETFTFSFLRRVLQEITLDA